MARRDLLKGAFAILPLQTATASTTPGGVYTRVASVSVAGPIVMLSLVSNLAVDG